MKKAKIKNSRGITLVALVITIVILIILATITINVAFGEGGLIERAQQAKELTEQAVKDEEEKLNAVMSEYGDLINGMNGGGAGANEVDPGPIDPTEQVPTPIEEVTKGEELENTTKVEAPVDSDGENPEETGTIYVPGGFGIDEESPNDINDGIVISNADDSKQFVWIPVSSAQLADMYQETSVQLSTVTDMTPVTTDRYSKLRKNATEFYDTNTYKPGTSNCREPDILTDTDTSGWGGDAGNIAIIKSVFASELAEYDVDTSSNPTDAQVLNAFAQMLVDEYNATYESIATYGGFYIGRYEISGSVESPTVKQGGTVLVSQKWYNLKKACNNVVNNENVVSEMIYGNQWDRVLNWLVETGAKTQDEVYNDSSSWGNYNNYNTANPEHQVTDAGTNIFPAGSSDYWCANNIYDLAGNAFDWTQEADNSFYRVYRGGCFQRPWFRPCSFQSLRRLSSAYPQLQFRSSSIVRQVKLRVPRWHEQFHNQI